VSRSGAFFLAPILSGVAAVFSSMLHVILDVPILLIWAFITIFFITTVVLSPKLRVVSMENLVGILRSRIDLMFMLIFSAGSAAALISTPAPLGWDARSMWFAIPSYLNGPAEQYLTAQAGGAQTGWVDYPLFGPGSLATVWQLMGVSENLWAGSRFYGVIGISLVALVGYLLFTKYGSDKNIYFVAIAFSSLVSAGFFIGGGINTGYMDTIQGLLVAATLASCLIWSRESLLRSTALVGLVSIAAMSAKQEGFWLVLLVLSVSAVFYLPNTQFWFLLSILPLTASRLFWVSFSDHVNMPESRSTGGLIERIPELLDPSSLAWEIVAKILFDWFIPQNGKLFIIFVLAVAALLVANRTSSIRAKYLDVILYFMVGLGILTIIFLTYSLGDLRGQIDWWLGTSYSRITASFKSVVWTSLFALVLLNLPAKYLPKKKGLTKKID
jgi:hypothetical protein